jgi:hypothetical protein
MAYGDPINIDPLTNDGLGSIYGDRPRKSRRQIKRSDMLAQALQENAIDSSPKGHWTQVLGQMAQGAAGGYIQNKADQADEERRQAMASMLGGDMTPSELENYGAVNDDPTLIQIAQNRRAAEAKGTTDDLDEYNFYASQQRAAGKEPVPFYDYQLGLKKANATNVNTSVQTGDNAYAKERASGKGGFASTANEITTEGRHAQDSINTIGAMRNTLSDPNFYSGPGADQVLALKRMAVALGGDPDQVSSMESFGALSKKAALDAMGGSLGSGFSNADRSFVTEQVASAQNTPQGNLAVLNITEKLQRRKIDIAKMARKYEQDNGQIDNGFYDQIETWSEANPLFPEAANTPKPPKSKVISVE